MVPFFLLPRLVLPILMCALWQTVAAAPAEQTARAYPDHAIKLIVPFPPGGATDALGRVLANALAEKLSQPVVVENKPGASTILAASYVVKAPADGYTLLLASNSTLTLNPALRPALPYDPSRSFSFIGPAARMDLAVLVKADSPVRSLQTLLDAAAAQPGKVTYATFGVGSSVHFAAEMLMASANAKMVHVPFNGSAPSLMALMGGQVDASVDSVVAAAPFIKGGKIRALSVLSDRRSPLLPEVPTTAEGGWQDTSLEAWFAVVAPANLPVAVKRKLEAALQESLGSPAVKHKLLDIGLTATPGPANAVASRIDHELPQMRAVAARAAIKAD